MGLRTGRTTSESAKIIHSALDAGINIIDTATAYQTEALVAAGLRGRPRDRVVISSKRGLRSESGNGLLSKEELIKSVENSLRCLETDYIDIYHLHAVSPDEYGYASEEMVPTLQKLKLAGKVRFLGITERFEEDTQHLALSRTIKEGLVDVVMVGFNMLNQTAREIVLQVAANNDIGTMIMFAVRRVFSQPQRLQELINQLAESEEIDPELTKDADPLSFLLAESPDLTDAAYRYCLQQPGVSTVLSGTGNIDHLLSNITSFARGPLSSTATSQIDRIFANVRSVSGS